MIDGRPAGRNEISLRSGFSRAGTPLNLWVVRERDIALTAMVRPRWRGMSPRPGRGFLGALNAPEAMECRGEPQSHQRVDQTAIRLQERRQPLLPGGMQREGKTGGSKICGIFPPLPSSALEGKNDSGERILSCKAQLAVSPDPQPVLNHYNLSLLCCRGSVPQNSVFLHPLKGKPARRFARGGIEGRASAARMTGAWLSHKGVILR